MTALNWPDGIFPRSQKFYLLARTTHFITSLTGQIQTLERKGTRWIAELTFNLDQKNAPELDALIAALRGSTGHILVPDFRRNNAETVSESMDAYAAEIGLTFFEDRYDFDDQTHEDGFLTTEETPPFGTEDNALFGSAFDAALIFPDEVMLLTEAGDTLLADNVGIPFVAEQGFLLTLEHGDALEICIEEGFTFWTEQSEELLAVQVGGGFYEGDGQPTLLGASAHELQINGCAPWTKIIKAGQGISPVEGHAYLILEDITTDINGQAIVPFMPRLRAAPAEQPLVLGNIKVLMRLLNDEAGDNAAIPPNISSYTLKFEEVLA